MADRAFFTLLDVLEQEDDIRPEHFFDLMRTSFQIAGLLYLRAGLSGGAVLPYRVHHTFSAGIADLFTHEDAIGNNPFLSSIAGGGIRPLDWATLRAARPHMSAFFQACDAAGMGSQGVTLPLTATGKSVALLAIESGLPADAWQVYSRQHLRDFQYLANLFHAGLVERDDRHRPLPQKARLTARETEVLGWAAAGKSYWEIAVILGISERTVRFFMTNARRKLNVVSNAQAVATAVRHDLLHTR